jgi:hypothetical protein
MTQASAASTLAMELDVFKDLRMLRRPHFGSKRAAQSHVRCHAEPSAHTPSLWR